MRFHLTAGSPVRMGAHLEGDGVNFAVFSAHAEKMELCLFSDDGTQETDRIALPERTGDIWHGRLEGLGAGTVYGYRAHGAYTPHEGHRFNPNKLLLDPYTRALRGRFSDHPATLGYRDKDAAKDMSFDTRDSAPYVAKSVVTHPAMFPTGAERLGTPWEDTLIYEAHVKGLTQLHPTVPEHIRGTYDALASEPMLEHLNKLGVTAIELMPVHAFIDDGFLLKKELSNYWGYNTIGFFTPEPRYFGPAGISGFRDMVARFHEAGIEVLLDVVYNHTAEGDHRGPTLSFRGLDNASYYRLFDDDPRYYVNDTGTGNTVDVSHPNVLRLVLDSLRFWVDCMGVDGFRFDLATTLAREDHGFDACGGFFDALRQDPTLAGVKLIAEPWDIGPGGYQLGSFPPEFAEWNDTYRDTVRRFWKNEAHSTQELGTRLLGSAGEFDHHGRRSTSSINFLAAHDGFTLADVTAYNRRHNEANREDNRDGHLANHSDNCGAEGPTRNPKIQKKRAARQRNMLATLFLSQGTPMLLAGDEMGNSQSGNNNAYCQDNPTGWVDWAADAGGLADYVAHLSAFRRAHPALRQSRFLHGRKREQDGHPDVAWYDASGGALDWHDPHLSTLCVLYRGSAETEMHFAEDDAVFVALSRAKSEIEVMPPELPNGWSWMTGVDSRQYVQEPKLVSGNRLMFEGPAVIALFPVQTALNDDN